MLHALILAALVPVLAVLHRIRGGGIVPGLLPRLAWVAINSVVVAGFTFAGGAHWLVALTLGLTYAAFCIPGWEKELCAAEGAAIPAGQVTASDWTVRSVWWLSGSHPVLACYLRAALPLLPSVAALEALAHIWCIGSSWDPAPLAAIVLAFWPVYLAAWHLYRRLGLADQCVIAEPSMGAVMGASFAGVVLLAI